jgi:hypothetical protein
VVTGTVTGHVLIDEGAADGGAPRAATVEIKSGRHVLGRDRVPPDGEFQFTERPGSYDLTALGIRNCEGKVRIRAHKHSHAKLVCTPWPSVAEVPHDRSFGGYP